MAIEEETKKGRKAIANKETAHGILEKETEKMESTQSIKLIYCKLT